MRVDQRQQIQESIKSGDIRVVFTTNALEIGLDVGGLDGVVLAGFPPSIMSAWQQIGRAGRGWDRDAFVLFYAMKVLDFVESSGPRPSHLTTALPVSESVKSVTDC